MYIHYMRLKSKAHGLTSWHDIVAKLDHIIFAGDKPLRHGAAHVWVALDNDKSVGFMCAEVVGAHVRIMRYGVLAHYRKHGLGRRLLQCCIRFTRRYKYRDSITYTTPDNSASMNALIRAGYRTYTPVRPYAPAHMVYWFRPA